MTRYTCETLGRHHERKRFRCGVEVLDEYLARFAAQDIKRKAAAVFVLSPTESPSRIAGFYTLCSTSIALTQPPQSVTRKLPRYPDVPAILIGRLARDNAFPGVGSLLLADALARCVCVANEIAATVIVVDTKDVKARNFYKKFGFLTLPNLTHRMFLPMATAEMLV